MNYHVFQRDQTVHVLFLDTDCFCSFTPGRSNSYIMIPHVRKACEQPKGTI